MKKVFSLLEGLLVLVLLFSSSVIYSAEDSIPKTINVQGKLTTDSGQALSGKDYSMKFNIYENGVSVFEKTISGTVDDNGLYTQNIDVSTFNQNFSKAYTFKVKITVDGKDIESKETSFASSPYAFYSSTSTYTLKLDPENGEKLVNENFNQSTATWTTDNTYNIAVGSATYAINATTSTYAEKIATSGAQNYVWATLDAQGTQGWKSSGSISVDTATWAYTLIPVSESGTALTDGNFTTVTSDPTYKYDIRVGTAVWTESLKSDFILPTTNFSTTNLYNINVDTANWAKEMSTDGTNGYVWGMTSATEQGWLSPSSLGIAKASKTVLGGIMLGDNTGLSNDISSDGILRLSKATTSNIGGVIIGSNINVADGVVSVSTATDSILGVVKVSKTNGLSISEEGLVAVGQASKDNYGTVKIGENINVTNGVISINPSSLIIPLATTVSTGTVKIGSNININNGEISVNTASESNLGVMKLYTDIGNNTDGTITQSAIKTAVDNKVTKNVDIAGATHTKITYDAKGLVTAGADLSSSDITTALGYTPYNSTNPDSYITKDVNDLTNYTTTTNMNTELGKKQNTIDSSNKLSATFVDGLATVATSGSYNDLTDKPTVPTKTSDLTNDSNFVVDTNYVHTDVNFTSALNSKYDGYSSTLSNHEGRIAALEANSGADLAEIYKSTEKLVPGDVVSIDTTKDNSIVKTKVAEDTLVAGVISTEPGVLLNKSEKGYKLALVGKVPTKVCNEGGNIKRGDLLVSASIAGYAKKAGDNPKAGTVIGKALENFDSHKGTILVLVNLQ